MGTVFRLDTFKTVDFLKKNSILVILVFLFIVGLTVGIFTSAQLDSLNEFSVSYLEDFISTRNGTAFFSIVINSFMSSGLMILIVFACGTSLLGSVLIPIAVFFRGTLYGGVLSVLYSQYSLKGIAFNAVIIIPSAMVFVIALILASRESFRFSLIIAKLFIPSTLPINLSYDFKNYCGRYIFICLTAFLSAIIDAVISRSFLTSFLL